MSEELHKMSIHGRQDVRNAYIARPGWLMSVVWLGTWLLFVLGPVEYHRQPSIETWMLIVLANVIFALGVFGGCRLSRFPATSGSGISFSLLNHTVTFSAVVGTVGAIAIVIDKYCFSGLDYSQGLAAIRYQRVADLDAGIDIHRTVLLYVGYLTFSFSYPAISLWQLEAERLSIRSSVFAQISVLSPILYALIYGGRAPILLLCFLMCGTALVRVVQGKPPLAKAQGIRWKFIAICIGLVVYMNYTWEARREFSSVSSYEDYQLVAENSWALSPKNWINAAVIRRDISSEAAMNLMSTSMYITHGVVSLDKIRAKWAEYSPFLGAFQVGVISPLIRIAAPESHLIDRMASELRSTDIYGWFVTAWGAWFLDIGLAGTVLAVYLWGVGCGYTYAVVRSGSSMQAALMLSFGFCSILASPLNGPFGMANSVLIFGSYGIVAIMLSLLRNHPWTDKESLGELSLEI